MRIIDRNPLSQVQGELRPQRTDAKEQWLKFAECLQGAIQEVDDLQTESHRMTQNAVLGKVENLHDVMIAAEKAKIAMNLTLEVRGKVLEAYKEIMRMQF